MIRRRLLVHGHVQGVFYRASCAEEAERLGLAGWVANRDDGTVEVVAQGAPATVERLIEWCHHGPAAAVVQRVEVTEEAATGESGFTVR